MNGFQLKLFAVLTMTIDHIGAVLFPEYRILRIIGRIAFPIYAAMIAEGVVHTHNRRRYLGQLVLCGVLSELPFRWVFGGRGLGLYNVLFTLALGAGACILWEKKHRFFALLMPAAAYFLQTDYQWFGVATVLMFFILRDHRRTEQAFALAMMIFVFVQSGGSSATEFFALLAMIPLGFYNGTRGSSGGKYGKYAFYLYYPAHLTVLALIA